MYSFILHFSHRVSAFLGNLVVNVSPLHTVSCHLPHSFVLSWFVCPSKRGGVLNQMIYGTAKR